MQKTNTPKIQRQTHTIDAEGKVLGRLATEVAVLLRGKNKPDFVPYKDIGDIVVIKNVEKLKFSGKKFDQKFYYHHTSWLGGLKKKSMREVYGQNPSEILRMAVFGMLTKNKLRALQIKRLRFVK